MSTGNLYNVYNAVEESVEVEKTFSSPLVIVPDAIISPNILYIKKVLDISGAIIGILLALPIIVILIVLILLTSKGSIIYTHERIGQFGKPFRIYKFRSMYQNAEENGPKLSSKNDMRITPVGRFMRRWRLDEIPNFINVFKGEMSLVGPRPERKFYIDQIVKRTPDFIKLLQVKPGVTSLGEVEYGYAENVDEMITRLQYDLYYLGNYSIFKDITILARTIRVVLKGKGV